MKEDVPKTVVTTTSTENTDLEKKTSSLKIEDPDEDDLDDLDGTGCSKFWNMSKADYKVRLARRFLRQGSQRGSR